MRLLEELGMIGLSPMPIGREIPEDQHNHPQMEHIPQCVLGGMSAWGAAYGLQTGRLPEVSRWRRLWKGLPPPARANLALAG